MLLIIPEKGHLISVCLRSILPDYTRITWNILCWDNIDMFLQRVLIMIPEEGKKAIGYQYVSGQSCQALQE